MWKYHKASLEGDVELGLSMKDGTKVADRKLLWVEGEAILFDDTYPHMVSHWVSSLAMSFWCGSVTPVMEAILTTRHVQLCD